MWSTITNHLRYCHFDFSKKKYSYPCTELYQAPRVPGGWGFQGFYTVGVLRWQGCQHCVPAAFTTKESLFIYYCYWLSPPRGYWMRTKGLDHLKNFNDFIGNRSRDLLSVGAVPQSTAQQLAPKLKHNVTLFLLLTLHYLQACSKCQASITSICLTDNDDGHNWLRNAMCHCFMMWTVHTWKRDADKTRQAPLIC